jgi:hypothetical protein
MTAVRPESLSDRVTRLETLFEGLGGQISRELEVAGKIHEATERSISALTAIVDHQDKRLDKIELRIAWAMGAVAVIVVVVDVLAPLLRQTLGLPT